MKKILLCRTVWVILLLFGLSFSCSERLQNSDVRTLSECSDFPLDEVQRAFESDYATVPSTRTDETFDDEVVLAPGRIVPAWDAVSYCYGDSDNPILQADVSFEACYEYHSMRWNEDGRFEFASIPSRLVVLKNSDTGETASWLFFWISDADCYPSGDLADISGLALYTTLGGIPVCAGRYDGGVLVGSASLLDNSRTWEENVGKLAALLPEDVFIARIQPKAATRNCEFGWELGIEEVTVVGYAPIKVLEPSFPEEWNTPPFIPPVDDLRFMPIHGGGGGTGANVDTDSPKPYLKNPKIKADKEICEMLDSLYQDCMGQTLINSITVEVNIKSTDGTGCEALTSVTKDGIVVNCTISMGQLVAPWSLMEELTHLYQNMRGGAYDAKLNKEVEAKLGWYAYLQRIGSFVDMRDALGGQGGEIYFEYMWECLLKNDMKDPMFFESFKNAAEELRNIDGYKNEKFDPNKMDCANLLELLKDCEYR